MALYQNSIKQKCIGMTMYLDDSQKAQAQIILRIS